MHVQSLQFENFLKSLFFIQAIVNMSHDPQITPRSQYSMVDCPYGFTEGCIGSQLIIAPPFHRHHLGKNDSLIYRTQENTSQTVILLCMPEQIPTGVTLLYHTLLT